MIHSEIAASEAADRLAIRELVDAYAHCADRRDAEGQKALFTEDTHFVVYMDGQGSDPTKADGRLASLRGHFRQGRRRLAVRRAQPLRGLDGN